MSSRFLVFGQPIQNISGSFFTTCLAACARIQCPVYSPSNLKTARPSFPPHAKIRDHEREGGRPRMSWSEDWDRKDEMPVDERLKVLAAEAGEPKRKRPRPCDVAVGVAGGGRPADSGSASVEKEEPSSGAAAASRVRPESAAAATTAVAVEDTDALDCGVCFLPLKPPIFQVHPFLEP
jgi:hypothetical protein